MTKNQLTAKRNFAEVGGPITQELASKMVKDFNDARPEDNTSCLIGRNIIEQILAQPGCVAMRFYNALDETGRQTLVYTGVDEYGKTMIEIAAVNTDGELAKIDAVLGDMTEGPGYHWFS
jgi:hypothetical protein